MKIVCEACQAKYSISDDKVRGKAFKIRCKKCSHIIVVRSTSASIPVAEGSSSAQQLPVSEGSGLSGLTSPAPASENSWHIVVEGEQVGPLSASDVRARLSRGEITGESFIWREGLADWLKISSVPDFADAGGGDDEVGTPFPAQSPTTVYPPGTAESAFAASPAPAEPDVFAAPTMVSSAPSADLFASPVAAAAPAPAASSFSFGGAAPAESPIRVHGGNGAGGGLTGQRHENSVLFSLSNLEALAAPASASSGLAPRPGLSNTGGSEGSGLIDIRSMAQMTLGSQSDSRIGSDLPTFGAPQFSPVAPVLLPIGPSSGPAKWVYVLIGVGLLFTLVAGGGAIMLLRKQSAPVAPPAPVIATTAPAPAPAAATPPAAAHPAVPTTPTAPANEALPPREAAKPTATTPKGPKKPTHGKGPHASDMASAAGPGPAPAPTPAAKPEPPQGKRDKLDELLDGALGGGGAKAKPRASDDDAPRSRPAPAPSASLPALDRTDIVKGMMGIQPKVKDCFNQYKVPGTAMMTVHLDNSGRVKGANASGKFAGTPTGTCLESAAKSAKFPATSTPSFQYPLMLH
jgi:predicted Zn finger-like uncharacterized protein